MTSTKDLLALAAVGLALLVAAVVPSMFRWLEVVCGRLAERKALAIVAVGLFPLLVRALLLPVMPAPQPQAQDEFSYLLAADTFVHGRLANPEHPFATHFESMHILVRPKYVSIFPIGQGLTLALGKVVFGHPWAGVWISAGLMCGAVCWALQGWVSPGWALFGGWLFALRLGVFSYWMNSYWGGALAAFGGALVLGALPRMLSRRSRMDAVWLGIGLAILANSRPFEGLVFALLMFGVACFKAKSIPLVWPAVLIVAVTAAGMSYYFWRATGSPLRLPYVEYRTTMASAPHFIFQTPRQMPVYHHDTLRTFGDWELGIYRIARDESVVVAAALRAETYWRFYLGVLFTIPLLMLPWLWKDRDARLLVCAGVLFFLIALAPQVWYSPHYAAPATGLAALIVTMGIEKLRGWPIGRVLTRALPVAVALSLIVDAGARSPNLAGSRWITWGDTGTPRAAIQERLQRLGGHHLVLVRYSAHHDVNNEWVYNGADLDASPVVWAREMGPARDGEFLRHFASRKVWLVEPDAAPPRISPYPTEKVQDPDALKQAVLKAGSEACGAAACPFTCDQWNYLLTHATENPGPNVERGCVVGGDRSSPVSFEHWSAWLQGER